jgi:tetratricopeptide (TPR) repeat protein
MNNIAEIMSDQGRLKEAEELFREALRAFRAAGSGMMRGLALGNLGRVASREGRFDEALPLLERSVELLRDVGDLPQSLESETRIAELFLFEGRWEDARAAGRETLTKAEGLMGVSPQVPVLHRIIGYALAGRGEMDEARAALETSLETGRARDAGYEVAMTLRAFSELFPRDPSWDAWRSEAEEMLRELGVESSRPVPIVSVPEAVETSRS